MEAPESRSSCPTLIPMAQCVPFLGLFLIDLEMLDNAMADHLEVGDLGPRQG